MKNILRTVASVALMAALGACAVNPIETPPQIALLAPFEGRYRDVGYNAVYATQLAITESDVHIELLAVDDGGNVETATERIQALTLDERVIAVIVMGYAATETTVLGASATLPVLIAGYWGVETTASNVFAVHHPDVPAQITTPERVEITQPSQDGTPFTGGLIFSLEQFTELYPESQDVVVVSSFALPDDAFTERYLTASPFAPQPGLIASAAYDTTIYLLDHIRDDTMARASLLDVLQGASSPDLALHFYEYNDNGVLLPVDRIVEEW